MLFNLKNLNRINGEFITDNEYKFQKFPFYFVKEKTFESKIKKGQNFSKTIHHCWAVKPTCSGTIPQVKKLYGYIFINR